MKEIFLDYLETSAIVSVVILAVALLSAIIDKRFTAKWKYWIWLIIAFVLIFPIAPNIEINKIEVPIPDRVINSPYEEMYRPEIHFDSVPMAPSTDPNPNLSTENSPETFEQQQVVFEHVDREDKEPVMSTGPIVTVSLLDIIAVIWALGAVGFFAWNLITYAFFKYRMNTYDLPDDGNERAVLASVKEKLKIKKEIKMLLCDNITSPMVMGIVNPKVILPFEEYDDGELYFILCHELTHYKRHDILYKSLLLLANALHWFNPAVWLLRKLAGSDLEISCDSLVVEKGDISLRKRYSETILASVHRENVACSAFMTHFYGGKKTLKKRFENIFNQGKRRRGTAAFIIVIGVIAIMGVTVSCSIAEQNTPKVYEIPAPTEEKFEKIEEMLSDIEAVKADEEAVFIDNKTLRIELIEEFLRTVDKNRRASVLGIAEIEEAYSAFELFYEPGGEIVLYRFNDKESSYSASVVERIYDTEFFYQFNDLEAAVLNVYKEEITSAKGIEDYSEGENLSDAKVSAYNAQKKASQLHTLYENLYNFSEGELDTKSRSANGRWSNKGFVIYEFFFPNEGIRDFYGKATEAATINGERFYKVEIHEYDGNKKALPYDGTSYYISAENSERIYKVDKETGELIPAARIYKSAMKRDEPSARFDLPESAAVIGGELKKGDEIGHWTLKELDVDYKDWPEESDCFAVFEGEVELSGFIEKNPRGDGYIFTLKYDEKGKMPYYRNDSRRYSDNDPFVAVLNLEEIDNAPNLEDGEMQEATITVSRYNCNYVNSKKDLSLDVKELEFTSSVHEIYYKGNFALGTNDPEYGRTVYVGEKIGDWTLERIQTNEDGKNTIYVAAEFSGDVVLSGKVKLSNTLSDGYMFEISEEDLLRMPYFAQKNMQGPRNILHFRYVDGENELLESLEYGESLACSITVSRYNYRDDTRHGTTSTVELSNIHVGGKSYDQDGDFATFKLGYNGEKTDLRLGDRIGNWNVGALSVKYDEYSLNPLEVEATFRGDVIIEGYIERDIMSGELNVFSADDESCAKLPLFVTEDWEQSGVYVRINIPDEYKALIPNLDYGEKYFCKITVNEYHFEYAPRMTVPSFKVTRIEESEFFENGRFEPVAFDGETPETMEELIEDKEKVFALLRKYSSPEIIVKNPSNESYGHLTAQKLAENPDVPEFLFKFFYTMYDGVAGLVKPDLSGFAGEGTDFTALEEQIRYYTAKKRVENYYYTAFDIDIVIEEQTGDTYICKVTTRATATDGTKPVISEYWEITLKNNSITKAECLERSETKFILGLQEEFEEIEKRFPEYENNPQMLASAGIAEYILGLQP